MSKINSGMVDPAGLRGLAGATQAIQTRSSGGPGYAEGGEITPQNAVPVQTGGPGVQRAVLVANEETMDQLVTGGKGALMRFLRDNSDEVKGLLR